MTNRILACTLFTCLGLTGLSAQTVDTWAGGTSKSIKSNGGDINNSWWLINGVAARSIGANDIAEITTSSPTGTDATGSFLGLNLAATGLNALTDNNGNYVKQIGALEIDAGRTSQLWIGTDTAATAGGGNGILQLNGATLEGLSNVIIDNKTAVVFQDNVKTVGNGATFGLQLGGTASNTTFVIKTVAPAAPPGAPAINILSPITEANSGSAINFRGGGTDTVAGGLIALNAPGARANTYSGGTILGNSSETGLADSDGVVLHILTATSLPKTGDILVNNGSALWLNGGSNFQYGSAGQTMTLNGAGTAANPNLVSGNPSAPIGMGALIVDAESTSVSSAFLGNINLATDSTVDVAGSGKFVESGTVMGNGALVKAGSGNFLLSSANTYSGGTVINGGTIETSNNNALGSSTSSVQINNGGTLKVDAGVQIAQKNVGLAYGGNYVKNYNAAESLANSMNVQSANGLKASLVAGQAGVSPAAVTATFAVDASGSTVSTVTGETLSVSGLQGNATAYTLQFQLDPSLIDGNAQLSYLNSSNVWDLAVNGNSGNVSGATFFNESYAQFASANDVTDANLANFLGDYGTDATTGTTWAVLNYDGQFSVTDVQSVPEPATWAYMLGGLGLLLWRLRHSRTRSLF